MPKKTEAQNPSTPLQRVLQEIALFRDNDIVENVVLKAAFQLTVASADPVWDAERAHIDNGLERLGGIAVQQSDAFKENFIDALIQGKNYAAEKGREVSAHVQEVADILSGAVKPQALIAA